MNCEDIKWEEKIPTELVEVKVETMQVWSFRCRAFDELNPYADYVDVRYYL